MTESLLQNFIAQCFLKSWFGVEKSIVQISWFLDLFWRWEVKICFLRNYVFYCVFIRLHGNIFSNLNMRNLSHKLSKQTTRQLSISFVIHDYQLIIIAMNDSKNNFWNRSSQWLLVIFVCWLAPNYKSIVTYFWKTNSIAMVTTGACAVVTKKNNQNCLMYSFF